MGAIYLTEEFTDLPQIQVGKKAPDFQLQDDKGNEWRLSDHLGQVTAILFYPKNETLVCTKQLCSLRDNWSDYLASKAVIVGVSPGNTEEHRQFSGRYNLPLPLLADSDRNVTKLYMYHWLYPVLFTRGIVVVDAKGIIRSKKNNASRLSSGRPHGHYGNSCCTCRCTLRKLRFNFASAGNLKVQNLT